MRRGGSFGYHDWVEVIYNCKPTSNQTSDINQTSELRWQIGAGIVYRSQIKGTANRSAKMIGLVLDEEVACSMESFGSRFQQKNVAD